jgi:hypothetical protein
VGWQLLGIVEAKKVTLAFRLSAAGLAFVQQGHFA